ncbi:centrosome and spindle pole-associated protein 1 [Genypterus blacodes]|uniref:centrosome and spindle pole-associated protein 1 n=1 Tax=Genypterus blacodes TaxID=154954 RepID=UPI003F7629E2
MEVESRAGETHNAVDRPSASLEPGQDKDHGVGLCSLLGTDYERKKQKLQQELFLDYQKYVAEKKDLKSNKHQLPPQGLSLPIDERKSVKEKLREERHKEYNLFLKDQLQTRKLKWAPPPTAHKPGEVQDVDGLPISSPPSPLPLIPPPHREQHPESRSDAATLPEAARAGKSRRTWSQGHQRQRDLDLLRQMEPYRSEEELHADREEEWEFRDRRKDRHSQEPEDRGQRITWGDRDNREPWDFKQAEPPGVHHQNNNNLVWSSKSVRPKFYHCDKICNAKTELFLCVSLFSMREAARSRSASHKEKAKFSTGLLIGATEENGASRKRKEQYKEELLKQIAEQQRNKMKERELELRVAASGAIDPEKKPDRLKQFGAVNRHHDSQRRDVPYKPGVGLDALGHEANPRWPRDDKPTQGTYESDYQRSSQAAVDFRAAASQLKGKRTGTGTGTAPGFLSAASFNDEYHRNLSGTLGELAVPRASGQHTPSQLSMGMVGVDRSKQTRERALSYQEALRQQMKEREAHKRREREERERYDAKLEAEMMVYNPWGRGGGGAPIKDNGGNLISDLKQMHKSNEEGYRNPTSRGARPVQNFVVRNSPTPDASQQHLPGFSDRPTPQQLHKQDRYKDDLRQQIEENRRRQEEERERVREEEEKEERRLAEQRARMKQQYEEEVRRAEERNKQQRSENHRLKMESDARRQEERKRMEEQEIQAPESHSGREERQERVPVQREPSPPIPTLQKKPRSHQASRPSSVLSQFSSSGAASESSVSAPYSPPVPAKRNQLRAKDDQQQKEVFRELSAQRRSLQRKRSELEEKLSRYREETHTPPPIRQRRRTKAEPSDVHGSARRPLSCVNTENIREFNQLKYRDTASREEVLHVYPDPPKDEQSLDIQQQALLRQQHRSYRHVQRGDEDDAMFQLSHHHPRAKPPLHRLGDSMLPFETTFLDVYGDDRPEELVPKQMSPQPPVKEQDSPIPLRSYGHDVVFPTDQSESLHSASSLNMQAELRPHSHDIITPDQDGGDHNWTQQSEGPSGDNVDVLSLRSSRSALERRFSMETVATEAWLRPGTSEGRRPAWLTQSVT